MVDRCRDRREVLKVQLNDTGVRIGFARLRFQVLNGPLGFFSRATDTVYLDVLGEKYSRFLLVCGDEKKNKKEMRNWDTERKNDFWTGND